MPSSHLHKLRVDNFGEELSGGWVKTVRLSVCRKGSSPCGSPDILQRRQEYLDGRESADRPEVLRTAERLLLSSFSRKSYLVPARPA